jgi:urease accessory protein
MTTASFRDIDLNKGWIAKLHLDFVEVDGKTVFKQNLHQGPLQVQKIFYPEVNGTGHVYILHPPGGVVGGDSFDVNINLNSNAKALITTPAAGKFYRSAGRIAYQKQTLEVANHGVLEWFPSENIFFPGAKVKLETRINLSETSHFIGWDILCLGRPSIGETFVKGQLTQRLEVFMDGRLIRLEKLIIQDNDPMLKAKWGLRGEPVVGTLFCITSRTELVDLLRENIDSLDRDNLFSVTLVDNVILCRYLGNSVEQVKQKFIKVWHLLRMALRGHESVIPRIWST